MSKQISVKINGVQYYPKNTSSTADKPAGEKDVNYRALVNDKLQELGTFYECYDEEIELGDKESLCLAYKSHANDDMFIISGRIQEVLGRQAFFGGENERPLYLSLSSSATWEEVYRSLLKNEQFIVARKKFRP